MKDHKRLRKDDPARTGPIRNFSGLYRQSDGDAIKPADPTTNGAATGGEDRANEEGVQLAYRVIEKHINDGKRHAGTINGQPYNTRTIGDGFQELLERTIRYQSELIPLWIEALSSTVRIDPARIANPLGSAWKPATNGASTNRGSNAISMEIASIRPVEVSIDLRENSETLPLITLGLRAVDDRKPPLNEVRFLREAAQGPLKLRISVPATHPSGTYSGVIVNRETGETRGTLSVRIAD